MLVHNTGSTSENMSRLRFKNERTNPPPTSNVKATRLLMSTFCWILIETAANGSNKISLGFLSIPQVPKLIKNVNFAVNFE